MKILHVIKGVGYGGASRSICAIAGALKEAGNDQISVATLTPVLEGREMFEEKGIRLIEEPSAAILFAEARRSDIVQVEWWNSPQIYAFLQSRLPPMRLVVWVHVAGDSWPHLLSDQLVGFADFVILGCPYAAQCPPIKSLESTERDRKTAVIYSTADFGRLQDLKPRAHEGFNIGYIGTASFKKMHPRFVSMSASIRIPDARFIVCGRGETDLLRSQAESLGVSDRFDFRGYVHDIKPVLECLDVYGYPLCDSPGAELNVQEAMFAEVPPVVFGLGGLQDIVKHKETGLVVDSEIEYAGAVEYLYRHPAERLRLGRNASAHAKQYFGGANSAAELQSVYERMLEQPKRRRNWNFTELAGNHQSVGVGALRYLESVHSQADFFLRSAVSGDLDEMLVADEKISSVSPRELTILRAYRDFYPDDPHLNLWHALAAARSNDHVEAVSGFRKASRCSRLWMRASWYLARALMDCGDDEGAASLLEEIVVAAPEFVPARRLRSRVGKIGELEPASL